MAASTSDKFRKGSSAFSTTLASQKAQGASSMSLSSATGVPTDTAVDLTVGRVDSNGNRTPSAKAIYKGTVSGTTVSNLTLVEGTDQLHAAGAVVEDTFNKQRWNDLIDGILISHNQDGTMITSLPLTTPKITTSINDANGNEVIKTPATSSAVNEITVTNAATGSAPEISATGGDTNIDLRLKGKGTGVPELYGGIVKGLIRKRQGGASGDATWQTAGTTDVDTSAKAVFIQTGVKAATNSAGGDTAVTFPSAFTYAPVVFAVAQTTGSANQLVAVNGVTTTGFNIRTTATAAGSENVAWVAIGQ